MALRTCGNNPLKIRVSLPECNSPSPLGEKRKNALRGWDCEVLVWYLHKDLFSACCDMSPFCLITASVQIDVFRLVKKVDNGILCPVTEICFNNELGHCKFLAQAIETGFGYGQWLHGEAVAVGMVKLFIF